MAETSRSISTRRLRVECTLSQDIMVADLPEERGGATNPRGTRRGALFLDGERGRLLLRDQARESSTMHPSAVGRTSPSRAAMRTGRMYKFVTLVTEDQHRPHEGDLHQGSQSPRTRTDKS